VVNSANPSPLPRLPALASRLRSGLWRGKPAVASASDGFGVPSCASAPQARGGGENIIRGDDVTQGGARSSLTVGYYQAIPTGFQFGSLRWQKTNARSQRPTTKDLRNANRMRIPRPLDSGVGPRVHCSCTFVLSGAVTRGECLKITTSGFLGRSGSESICRCEAK